MYLLQEFREGAVPFLCSNFSLDEECVTRVAVLSLCVTSWPAMDSAGEGILWPLVCEGRGKRLNWGGGIFNNFLQQD